MIKKSEKVDLEVLADDRMSNQKNKQTKKKKTKRETSNWTLLKNQKVMEHGPQRLSKGTRRAGIAGTETIQTTAFQNLAELLLL